MLVAIRQLTKEKLLAGSSSRDQAPFLCPECKRPVSLRKGLVNLAHFSHKRFGICAYGRGETEAHRRCKSEIYEYLRRHPKVQGAELEKSFGTVRADVFAYIRGTPVAIEVQISTLSPEKITYRTAEYTRKNIYVLWLLQWKPDLETTRYSPRRFERWVHAAYFGKAYFWKYGLTVVPYKFRLCDFAGNTREWNGAHGKMERNGANRISRRFRRPEAGKPVRIVEDFRPVLREPWSSGMTQIPKARIFSGYSTVAPRGKGAMDDKRARVK